MSVAASLGFPRIGRRRELKTALEAHWAGTLPEAGLRAEAAALRARHWRLQRGAGLGHVPSGDFALYDHVLDTACLLGAVPPGYGWAGEGPVGLATRFALARGSRGTAAEAAAGIAPGLPALELTKWFDTNYHYLVPVLAADQVFAPTGNDPLDAHREARALGLCTRPVLLGPVSFLLLSKTADGGDPLALLPRLLPAYAAILRGLEAEGIPWVQLDEPCLTADPGPDAVAALEAACAALAAAAPRLSLLLAGYYGGWGEALARVLALPVGGVHLDLVRDPGQLDAALAAAPPGLWFSLGVVDGRNVWRADLSAALATLRRAAAARADGAARLMVSSSCPLLHVPVELAQEDGLADEPRSWLAFATEKLAELRALKLALDAGPEGPEPAVARAFAEADAALAARRASARTHDPGVAARLAAATPAMERRPAPFAARRAAQRARLPDLPPLPTTMIGSLPQTAEVRRARAAAARDGDAAAYDAFLEAETARAVAWQEEAGLDVLVHGEFERNDMVQYFGERLEGFASARHGWVQSYGSRCVAPPILWGDVRRPAPMTVDWWRRAQARTARPVKGMLTGPVTLLQWSFVRDDLPRETVCRQLALAVRDEVADLEAAGCAVVQIDEPAFREGLPLRRAERGTYLAWAAACFRLASSGVADGTQVHTHMCYSEFGDILGAIADLDADVLSVETTRSRMELLAAFAAFDYPNDVGPGVWDIHSPRVPSADEMAGLLRLALGRVPAGRLWVNPDCGLKTRGWAEVRPAIANMVEAARRLRAEVGAP